MCLEFLLLLGICGCDVMDSLKRNIKLWKLWLPKNYFPPSSAVDGYIVDHTFFEVFVRRLSSLNFLQSYNFIMLAC